MEHPHTGCHPLPLPQPAQPPHLGPIGSFPSGTETHRGQAGGTELGEGRDHPKSTRPVWNPRPPPSQDSPFSPSPAMSSLLRRQGMATPTRQHLPGLWSLLLDLSTGVPFLSEHPRTTAVEQNHQRQRSQCWTLGANAGGQACSPTCTVALGMAHLPGAQGDGPSASVGRRLRNAHQASRRPAPHLTGPDSH